MMTASSISLTGAPLSVGGSRASSCVARLAIVSPARARDLAAP
jgi:hypothetical protein